MPIPTDLIINGLVGLLVAGAVLREFIKSRAAAKAVAPSQGPIVTAMAIGWSADQIERAIQALEALAAAAAMYQDTTKAEQVRQSNHIIALLEELRKKEVRR